MSIVGIRQTPLDDDRKVRANLRKLQAPPLEAPQVLSVEATPCSQGGSTCISVPRQRQVSGFSRRRNRSPGKPRRRRAPRRHHLRVAVDTEARFWAVYDAGTGADAAACGCGW